MLLASAGTQAYAMKYGPSSYNTYPRYYDSHPLPVPSFFKGKVLKQVIEVDSPSPAKWRYTIAVVSNVTSAFKNDGKRYKIELVAFGPGVKMLSTKFDKKNALALKKLVADGVKLRACHNAMLAMGLVRTNIFPFARVVPAGVLEVTRKIMQGYVPIKP